MAPQSWATAEEREFLISLLPEYEACQVKRKYKNFWLRVNKDFLAKFPVVAKLYPGVKESELTEEQRQRCAGAIAKVQKVCIFRSVTQPSALSFSIQRIKEWYRWQMNPRSRNAGFTISKKDLHSIYNTRTRVLKPYEVYAKLYQREVEEAKRKRCEEDVGIQCTCHSTIHKDTSVSNFFFVVIVFQRTTTASIVLALIVLLSSFLSLVLYI
ncbi:hypothetical protein NMY22_g19522 [Coprinellus aureogranulatus]|nr:hypothetical protein NMY22_g19522 [Coprinellus aureogranulatus]